MGVSKGKGGSMHLFDTSKNFMGGYAIVGGQLPIATGLALASQYNGEDRVVLCFMGDGALNEGEFHETMNLAAVWQLPVIFFCENNLYGMGNCPPSQAKTTWLPTTGTTAMPWPGGWTAAASWPSNSVTSGLPGEHRFLQRSSQRQGVGHG